MNAPSPTRQAGRFGIGALAGQIVLYGVFGAAIAVFSTWPSYRYLESDQGLLRLSFKHPGKIKADCRERSPEELAKLPPQLRVSADCPRERSPVRVRVALDDRSLMDESFAPAGLARDGASSGYRRLPISAGTHTLKVQVNDDVRVAGFNYEREATVQVKPGQVLLVDFGAERGGVTIR